MWNRPTLVLSKSKEPVRFVSSRTALEKVLCEKATIIDAHRDIPVRSMKIKLHLPNVIESYCFSPKITKKFSKLNVVYRDDQTCGYCLKRLPVNKLTIDHIIPKSRWKNSCKDQRVIDKFKKSTGLAQFPKKLNSWLNCVAACKKCNSKIKKDKYIWETGLVLINKPYIPEYTPRIIISREIAEKRRWIKYLSKFNDGRIVRLVEPF